jgi:glutamyl endopeptidase
MAKCPFAEWRPISGSSGAHAGGPFKIVHHTTEGSSAQGAFDAFRKNRTDPHFTVDSQKIYQHIDTNEGARALRNAAGGVQTNRDSAVQIEVVGFAGLPKSRATLLNLARLCRWIEKTHNVPRVWPNGLPKSAIGGKDPGGHNRNAANWDSKGGHYGHCHVPENTHWDPAYTQSEVDLIMGTEFESGEAMLSARLAEVFAAIPEAEPDLQGYESTMPDHAEVEDEEAFFVPGGATVKAAARPTAPAAPRDPHTPVNNFSTEAAVESEELSEPGNTGDIGDEPLPMVEGAEAVETVVSEAFGVAEVQWNVPDTTNLLDVGVASFGLPPAIMETVHGPDNRVRITDTAKYPWRVNASLLIIARDNSRWIGTGWFIGPHTLVTAGHCVYIHSGVPERDGWVKSIQLMPGRDGATLPFGSVTATQFWSVTGWTEGGDENYDYAAIILPQDLGNRVGWLGFSVLGEQTLKAATANIAGYPSDKDQGTLWYDKNTVAAVNANKVYYDIDTVGGQSGAAVYIALGDTRTAVAVHAYGGATTNSGTRISRPVYNNLVRWKE